MAVSILDQRGQPFRESAFVPATDWRDAEIELLRESILELEMGYAESGWTRLNPDTSMEFSREGLREITRLARLMYLKNPLINRAVEVQKFYVWALGWSVKAADPLVNEVIQEFLDDDKNRAELTSQQAAEGKEVELQTSGNLFFVFFPNESTGLVRVRSIEPNEIEDIICNPEDAREPWFYKRVWKEARFDASTGTGFAPVQQRTAYYPDWIYHPDQAVSKIGDYEVMTKNPVYHVPVGGLPGMKFGMPEIYSALDWARAAKEHLEDWAAVWRALSQFAFQLKTQRGTRAVAAAKTRLGTTVGNAGNGALDLNPPALPGSTFIQSEGVELMPMRASGATVDPNDSRRLWLMVAAGVGLPEIFFGDANVGNHATAKTMDRPTELRMTERQTLWTDVYGAIFDYVLRWAVRAPDGLLARRAQLVTNRNGDGEIIEWGLDDTGQEINPQVEIRFPDLLEHDIEARIRSIVDAATLGGHPSAGTIMPKRLTELVLTALGIDDIDEEIAEMFPDDPQAGDILPSAPSSQGGELRTEPSAGMAQAARVAEALRGWSESQVSELLHLMYDRTLREADAPPETGPQRRDTALAPLAGSLASDIGGQPTAGRKTRQTMLQAYRQAYESGLLHGNPDHTWGAADDVYVQNAVKSQMDYLRGFARDVRKGVLSDAQASARADLYGAPLNGAYSRGFIEGGKERGVTGYTWNTVGDDACCENCAPRDGVDYLVDELPGYPGEGDFGSELCLGGPACRCWLEPNEATE